MRRQQARGPFLSPPSREGRPFGRLAIFNWQVSPTVHKREESDLARFVRFELLSLDGVYLDARAVVAVTDHGAGSRIVLAGSETAYGVTASVQEVIKILEAARDHT